MIPLRGPRRIVAAGGTLFHLAAQHMGSAEAWTRIAAANGLDDPWFTDVLTLTIPPPDTRAESGGVLYPGYRLRQPPAGAAPPG